jgi:D-arabinose 1-dehydrogenase-like Zn-dependent alcohol dehydrogenase
VDRENAIVGSKIGSPAAMQEMLEFSAKHSCFPQVEVIDFADAQAGFEKLISGAPRYRVVMKIEGFRAAQAASQ